MRCPPECDAEEGYHDKKCSLRRDGPLPDRIEQRGQHTVKIRDGRAVVLAFVLPVPASMGDEVDVELELTPDQARGLAGALSGAADQIAPPA